MTKAASGTPAARPLTGRELNALTAQVQRALRRARGEEYAGLVPAVGRPQTTAGDHVLVAAREMDTERIITASGGKLLRLALDHWAAVLTRAGYVVARHEQQPVLVVRPKVRPTVHELYRAVDAVRARRGLSWEDLAREARLSHEHLVRLQARVVRRGVRARLESWLHRHTAPPSPPPNAHAPAQEGAHHGGGSPHPADPHP
ncbi:hypothetical protein AB0C10_21510 [Microbispora amethystogenes]|uniref:hypothetical protein n=1 Tax=Microbispora amethystogenes TaxID=1427754 RepID=UPI003403E5B2